jgi:hypothetical protein
LRSPDAADAYPEPVGTRADQDVIPESFVRACESLRAVRLRPEVVVEETPAPQRLAPHAVALTADVLRGDDELGTGRFVLLHDPSGHETWNGTFRVVTFARAPLESELAHDPMLGSVGWSWLEDALAARDVRYLAPSGTVTRVASESFGSMADRGPAAELEIRASWTAEDSRLGPHLEAWADLLCTVAGLPPPIGGVFEIAQPRQGSRRAR